MPRALLSVFDKTGVVDFARELHNLGWELSSSGGTAKVIADAGIPVVDVADTLSSLEARVHATEHALVINALQQLITQQKAPTS